MGISEGGYGAHEGFQGIGFAVPINVAKQVAQQLIEHGRVPRVALGCDTEKLSSEVAQHLGIVETSGLIVTNVNLRSSADEAGLRVGDVITHFDGTKVSGNVEFLELIERAAADCDIAFRVVRDRREIEIIVDPEELIDDQQVPPRTVRKTDERPSGYRDLRVGLTLDRLSPNWPTTWDIRNLLMGWSLLMSSQKVLPPRKA